MTSHPGDQKKINWHELKRRAIPVPVRKPLIRRDPVELEQDDSVLGFGQLRQSGDKIASYAISYRKDFVMAASISARHRSSSCSMSRSCESALNHLPSARSKSSEPHYIPDVNVPAFTTVSYKPVNLDLRPIRTSSPRRSFVNSTISKTSKISLLDDQNLQQKLY